MAKKTTTTDAEGRKEGDQPGPLNEGPPVDERELPSARTRIAELEEQIIQASLNRDAAKGELKSETAAHEETRSRLAEEQTERVKSDAEVVRLAAANEGLQEQLASARATIESLEEDVTTWKGLAFLGGLGTAANLIPRQ